MSDNGKLTWTNERRKLGDLIPWPRNPVRMSERQAEGLKISIDKFGLAIPPLISPSNKLYDGHQRKRVMNLMDEYGPDAMIDVRVSSRELTEEEHEELAVRFRKNTGDFDFDELGNWDVPNLVEWGFEPFELGIDLEPEAAGTDTEPAVDKAEQLQEKWGTQLGQVWQLGEHRLCCGDCTDKAVVEAVMQGEKAELVVTDPPYGVSYADKNKWLNAISPGNRIQTEIENDHADKDKTQAMWKAAFCEMEKAMQPGAVVYCFMPQGGDQMMMMMMMGAGIEPRHELIWLKNNHVLGRVDYAYKHEPILYAWKDGGHKFYGDFQTSILEYDKPLKSDLHPTMKPVELVERLIKNSSKSSDIVYDPFSGSGTTIIAADNLGRVARAVEIDPGYVAVTLERYFQHTGTEPRY